MSSDYTIGNGTITNIANAIRAQEGSVGTIQVSNFADRISALVPTTQKTGDISNINTEYYGIGANTITAIGNAIKYQDGEFGPVSGFARRILALVGDETPWERPSSWPNYDYIDRTNEDALYYTIDTDGATEDMIIKFISTEPLACWKNETDIEEYRGASQISSGLKVERGYIDSNGFHAEETVSSLSTYTITVPINIRRYIVYRFSSIAPAKISAISPYFSQTTAKIVEIWGRTQHACVIGCPYTTVAWDVICDGYLLQSGHYMSHHALSTLRWGTTADSPQSGDVALEYINFNGINWDAVAEAGHYDGYLGHPMQIRYALNGVSNIKRLNLAGFRDNTIQVQDVNLMNIFANMEDLEKVYIPPMTLDIKYTRSGLIGLCGIFARDSKLTYLDLHNLTITFIRSTVSIGTIDCGSGASNRAWFYRCNNLETVYLPTIIQPSNHNLEFGYAFGYMNNCEEIYNVPDVYCRYQQTQYVDRIVLFFYYSSKLSRATMLRFFNTISPIYSDGENEYARMHFIVPTPVVDRLSVEDIAILTSKGHTLSTTSEY